MLAALGKKGTIVNIARGSIIDEPALVAALQSGTIKAAGLDVFADEPHVPKALLAMDNVVLLPHVGSATQRDAQGDGRPVQGEPRRVVRRQAAVTLIPSSLNPLLADLPYHRRRAGHSVARDRLERGRRGSARNASARALKSMRFSGRAKPWPSSG